jgi:hypothetical protein
VSKRILGGSNGYRSGIVICNLNNPPLYGV